MPGPLDGVRVIDLTAVLLGPLATLHLGDMGADVVKIEPPRGDSLRQAGRGRNPDMGPIFLTANRNKRSLCLDLKQPAAVDIVKRLAAKADVFVHNNRPQAIDRLGLGYADIAAVNPGIVYAYALGYKRAGPYGHKPAFDDLIQGESGGAMLQHRIDGKGPRFLPSLIADKTTGLHLAMAILAALYHRQRTGEGQLVEVPMLETLTAFWLTEHLFGHTFDPPTEDFGYDRIMTVLRRPFASKDGFICVLPYMDRQWVGCAEALGRPELVTDPRFVTMTARARNIAAVMQVLSEALPARTTADWLERFDAADVPATRANDLADLFDHPHLAATGFFTRREHPSEGTIRTTASPLDFARTPTQYHRHAPRLGADGREVLAEAGWSELEIEKLIAAGTLIVPGAEAAAAQPARPGPQCSRT